MPKTLTIRIDDKTYSAFAKRAKAENRSLANFIETAVKAHIQESAFVDDSEMAEILACPVSTVKSRLYTALDLLKTTLAPAVLRGES